MLQYLFYPDSKIKSRVYTIERSCMIQQAESYSPLLKAGGETYWDKKLKRHKDLKLKVASCIVLRMNESHNWQKTTFIKLPECFGGYFAAPDWIQRLHKFALQRIKTCPNHRGFNGSSLMEHSHGRNLTCCSRKARVAPVTTLMVASIHKGVVESYGRHQRAETQGPDTPSFHEDFMDVIATGHNVTLRKVGAIIY